MKTLNLRSIMWAIPFVIGSVALTSCDDDDDDLDDNRNYSISGNASGSQVVPPVSGSGQGTITGTYDAKTNTLIYTSTWTNLTSAPTSAGLYAGASGTTGVLIGSTWPSLAATLSGTTTGTVVLTDAQETQLLSNGMYYTYSTTSNPGGEVRGQITASVM